MKPRKYQARTPTRAQVRAAFAFQAPLDRPAPEIRKPKRAGIKDKSKCDHDWQIGFYGPRCHKCGYGVGRYDGVGGTDGTKS